VPALHRQFPTDLQARQTTAQSRRTLKKLGSDLGHAVERSRPRVTLPFIAEPWVLPLAKAEDRLQRSKTPKSRTSDCSACEQDSQ